MKLLLCFYGALGQTLDLPKILYIVLSPLGSFFFFKPIWGGGGGGLFEREGLHAFNLEKTMISVLHKELQYVEYKVEKLKYKKVGGHAAEDQNQIRTSS